jgi:flagellar basal-body rod modification protein FlgD
MTTTTAPTATAPTAPVTDSSALGRARLAENFDTFLSLLTTQLKNQDPLSPLDSNQFTEQLTQMTGVEQQLLTNDLLKQLVSNTGTGVATAVSLIGKQVRADSADAALSNGKATWAYKLERDAADVKLEVLDSKGVVVRTIAPTDNKAGEHSIEWDGKNGVGDKMPDGTYTLRITAKDSQGSEVTSSAFVNGVVTGVEQANGSTLISVNGVKITWDKVISIAQPPAASTASTDTNGATTDASNNNPDDKTSSPATA